MEVDPSFFQENERTAPTQDGKKFFEIGSFVTERGETIPQVVVAYETWGKLNPAADNAILVCHALSGDSHAIGWWDRIVGPGLAIDTDRFFVIGTNALGGCQGTTGPGTLAPDGRRWGSRFPQVTVGDMVEVQMQLVSGLGIQTLFGVAGGSMGGMQALEWTLRRSGAVRRCWMTASCAAHSPMQIGFNETARQAILRDPKWCGGDFDPSNPPADGLAVARMVGHLSYLSAVSFDRKFGRRRQAGGPADQFEVESYLNYQGEKFVSRFDAGSLVVLSKAIDLYERTSLAGSTSEYLLTSFSSDTLYEPRQSQAVHELALAAGCRSRHLTFDLPMGHDTFLLDGEQQAHVARDFWDNGIENRGSW